MLTAIEPAGQLLHAALMDAARGDAAPSLDRAIFAIALPAMLTNLATALFGIADLWVIGQLGQATAQASVELGAKFMMALLIVFNFLRTGTIALTAQAAGRGAEEELGETLARAIGAALLIGLLLLALMPVAIPTGLELLAASGGVAEGAGLYVGIRYWGGPLWLVNAALAGWLIGRRRVREVLVVEVAANLLHVGLDLLFVLGFGWGIAGVAFATLASEAAKTFLLFLVAAREPALASALLALRRAATWRREELARLFRINRDLFVRTLLLMAATLLLTRDGAQEGAVVLAANGILYQLFILSALLLDGYENAAQVLCGEAYGARRREQFGALVRRLHLWGLATAAFVSAAFAAGGLHFAASFSTDAQVQQALETYFGWAIVLPLAGVVSFVFDGIYIGAGWTRALLATMGAAFAAYGLLLIGSGTLGNHGLWLSFTIFLLARAAFQAILLPRLVRASFSDPNPAA